MRCNEVREVICWVLKGLLKGQDTLLRVCGILVTTSRTDRITLGCRYKAELGACQYLDCASWESQSPVLHSNVWFGLFRLQHSAQ